MIDIAKKLINVRANFEQSGGYCWLHGTVLLTGTEKLKIACENFCRSYFYRHETLKIETHWNSSTHSNGLIIVESKWSISQVYHQRKWWTGENAKFLFDIHSFSNKTIKNVSQNYAGEIDAPYIFLSNKMCIIFILQYIDEVTG